ncbi:hypothetical protein [Agromyces indicus]|uniref:Uncharacterized protein n=1 Tax=Agromyces indicus TaxID=758919 RepID=A0ABU1FFZ8_9MICO|nr:hypothetical protein [Agromyces indicus]MDR5690688.1 hypothetical protein [Agromyces indicus]
MTALAAITRSWPMLGALGAGLVLAALAAGAGGATQVALAGLGIAALGWGVLSLRAGRALAPRSTLGTCVGALLAAGGAVAAGATTGIPGGPLAAASVFIATVALSAALDLRRRRGRRTAAADARASAEAHPRLGLIGLMVGAALVSALATPALAATEAGELAVPHGEHGTHDPGHRH